jgi:hypothetical protein
MASETKLELCAYCGLEPGKTVDHIPPKLFFAPPYPNNLLTVPACPACNKSFQADDEYTRFIISIDFRAQKNTAAQLKMPAVLRSFQRPESRTFSRYLLSQMSNSVILGADGKPMGQTVEVDRNRVNATGNRMVRGLHYIEKKISLGQPEEFRVASKAGVAATDPAIQQFARMYAGSVERRTRDIGDVFSYAVCFYPTFSIWFLLLYGYFSWLASTKSGDAIKPVISEGDKGAIRTP